MIHHENHGKPWFFYFTKQSRMEFFCILRLIIAFYKICGIINMCVNAYKGDIRFERKN